MSYHPPARKTTFAGDVPRCCSPEQYKVWKLATAGCQPVNNVGFCEDCTPEYQKKMILERRCENPGIDFFWEPIHFIKQRHNGRASEAGGYIYGAFGPGTHALPDGTTVEHEQVFDSL